MKVNKLPILEHFNTIQGEGAFTGSPAYFIRTSACDVGCPFCDIKESWKVEEHHWQSIEDLYDFAKVSDTVVVTGGEPFMHNLIDFTTFFKAKNIQRHVETSGAYPFSGDWDWITLSPKKRKLPREEFWPIASELKVVIGRKNDLIFAEECAQKVSDDCVLYLQPEWDNSDKILPQIIAYVKENRQWKISLQTHKFMNIP
jgi:organic radical activating enzyme